MVLAILVVLTILVILVAPAGLMIHDGLGTVML